MSFDNTLDQLVIEAAYERIQNGCAWTSDEIYISREFVLAHFGLWEPTPRERERPH
jgi:hypothetical protein